MATKVRDLMTPDPTILAASESAATAAHRMRDHDIGDVLIEDDGTLRGIVTDRDLTVRVLAEGIDGDSISLGDVCTTDLVTVGPDDALGDVVGLMRREAIRRVPVAEDGTAVGVLAIGDLATVEDPDSALADISAAGGNN